MSLRSKLAATFWKVTALERYRALLRVWLGSEDLSIYHLVRTALLLGKLSVTSPPPLPRVVRTYSSLEMRTPWGQEGSE